MAPKKQKKSAKAGSENKTENASEPEFRASGTCDNHEPGASEPQLEESEQPAVTSTGAVTRSSGGTRGVPGPDCSPISSTFKVGPHCEDIVLKSAGSKWRQFKTDLTRKFVLLFVGDKKKLNKPPKRYGFVSKSTWKNFVKQRTDPSWTGIHEVLSERVSLRKYHHRLSSKGYIGLKEDEIKKGKLQPEEEPDRAIFWQKARKRKNGEEVEEVDEDLAAVCEKIKELLARNRERDEKVDKKTQALEAEVAELKPMMASRIALHSPIMSEKASHQLEKAFVVACSDDDDDVDECVSTPAPPGVLRSCELSVNTIDNKVAFGMVYPGKDKEKVHGIDIPLGHKCVSVDGLLKSDALLPVPIKKKERKRPGTKPGLDLNNLKSDFLEAKPSVKVPKGFNLLYKHAVTWMKTTGVSIQIKCEKEVFGHEKVIYLLHENVQAVLEFEMLGQAVLASYMTYLHSEMSERPELADTFAFIDPGSTYYLNAEFETYIVNRLKEGNPDRLFFLPHNQNMHWILAIIWEGEIYFLNPLPHPVKFPDLEKALSRALKSFNSETGKGNHKPSKAKFLSGSPKQPGGMECAYVVMRYMKEIINDTRLTFTTKWLQKTRMCYTEEQLDELRVEALRYIQEHI
ncbi:hypothetical protein AgCh_011296 [Apium graveolens]